MGDFHPVRYTAIVNNYSNRHAGCSTPARGGTSTRRVVSSPSFGIATTPTPLSVLENLPTLIHNPEACAMIKDPVRT